MVLKVQIDKSKPKSTVIQAGDLGELESNIGEIYNMGKVWARIPNY